AQPVRVVRLDSVTIRAAVKYNTSMLDRASATPSAGGNAGRSIRTDSFAVRTVLFGALALLGTLSLTASGAADAPSNIAPNHPASSNAAPSAATALSARAQALFAQGNQYWTQAFNVGGSYSPAELAFFSGQIKNVCNDAEPLTGPFYCPDDLK